MSSEMMEIATRTSISVKAASAFADLWTIALPPLAVRNRVSAGLIDRRSARGAPSPVRLRVRAQRTYGKRTRAARDDTILRHTASKTARTARPASQ
jgi:hypothetical protein